MKRTIVRWFREWRAAHNAPTDTEGRARAEAWDECADESYGYGHMHDVARDEMKARNPYRESGGAS